MAAGLNRGHVHCRGRRERAGTVCLAGAAQPLPFLATHATEVGVEAKMRNAEAKEGKRWRGASPRKLLPGSDSNH